MESLYLLIPLGLVVVAGALALFLWAVNSGQFEDLDEQARRILDDEELDAPRTDDGAANRQ